MESHRDGRWTRRGNLSREAGRKTQTRKTRETVTREGHFEAQHLHLGKTKRKHRTDEGESEAATQGFAKSPRMSAGLHHRTATPRTLGTQSERCRDEGSGVAADSESRRTMRNIFQTRGGPRLPARCSISSLIIKKVLPDTQVLQKFTLYTLLRDRLEDVLHQSRRSLAVQEAESQCRTRARGVPARRAGWRRNGTSTENFLATMSSEHQTLPDTFDVNECFERKFR